MKFKKILKCILVSSILCIGLTACGTSDTNDNSVNSDDLQIALITKMVDLEYWQTVKSSAESKADEIGNINITHLGPSIESDINGQISILETCISTEYDGIILAACDQDALIEPVRKAKEAGIPVIMIDSGISDPIYDIFLSTDNVRGGAECAKLMAELIGGKGEVAIISASAGTSTAIEREEGFTNEINNNFPDIEIVSVQYCESDPNIAVNQATDLISTYDDLVGIWGSNDPSAIGIANAVDNLNKTDEIMVVGFDNSDDIIAGLNNGIIRGTAVQMPTVMGSKSVELMVDLINGNELEEKEVDTGVVMVTQDNLEDESSQQALYQ